MVYYFKSSVTSPPSIIYVGKDKTENCKFHVDNLSSAHIYLRLTGGEDWEKISKDLIEDCAQLTKANSIEGNKRDNVTIIYTPWSNLKKDGSMAVGQVGFHDHKKTKRILIAARTNAIINRLNKTRTEIPPAESTQHLKTERDAHLTSLRKVKNDDMRQKRKEEEKLRQQQRDDKLNREAAWAELTSQEAVEREGISNQDGGYDSDDFM